MVSQTPTEVCRRYALAVRNAAPREWEEFVQVFDAWATEVTVAVTGARQDEILNAQGKAQAFLHLLEVFKNPKPKQTNQPSP